MMKGLPNGVNHEKKGNKRALPEERYNSRIQVKNLGVMAYTLAVTCLMTPSLTVFFSFFTWFSDAQPKEDVDEEIHDEVMILYYHHLFVKSNTMSCPI